MYVFGNKSRMIHKAYIKNETLYWYAFSIKTEYFLSLWSFPGEFLFSLREVPGFRQRAFKMHCHGYFSVIFWLISKDTGSHLL